ncbi:MAG TPA: hypothetical protein VLK35_06190 [Methylomirabilota bacterium]|nr:hypothetical protein [Methylomirabilota bacterium]
MDAFWIKLFVLAVLAGLFALTVWLTPWLFRSSAAAGLDANAPAPRERPSAAPAPRSPD